MRGLVVSVSGYTSVSGACSHVKNARVLPAGGHIAAAHVRSYQTGVIGLGAGVHVVSVMPAVACSSLLQKAVINSAPNYACEREK